MGQESLSDAINFFDELNRSAFLDTNRAPVIAAEENSSQFMSNDKQNVYPGFF